MVAQLGALDLAARMKAGESVYLVDVRRPSEHETCALPGSVLVPLDELSHRLDEIDPPEGALVVCYCHHGVRSLSAAAILENAGFSRVVSLRGGIDAWALHVDPKVPRY
jgi:adenylyltransferase/sulfurtransferase